MSEEFEIPDDLAILENQLQSLKPAPSGMSRDKLMYQCGWAAAMAVQTRAAAEMNQDSRWVWPVATGTMATIAAVLAILLVQSTPVNEAQKNAAIQIADSPVVNPESEWVGDPDPSVNELVPPENEVEQFAETTATANRSIGSALRSPAGFSFSSGNILTPRSHVSLTDLESELDFEPVNVPGAKFPSYHKSQFELLQELLPQPNNESKQRKPRWDWFSKTWGDVI
jgi:hypothetical protein